jgi:hypothetical protein
MQTQSGKIGRSISASLGEVAVRPLDAARWVEEDEEGERWTRARREPARQQ